MIEQIFEITKKLEQNKITETEAKILLLGLFEDYLMASKEFGLNLNLTK